MKKRGFLLSLILLPAIYGAIHLIFRPKPVVKQPIIIAHRGAAGLAPENTLVAIKEAINRGANFIEVDVQRSTDNVLLLIHDKNVDRTTNGTGTVTELSWQDISKLDAGSHFSEKFTGEPVPTLDAALKLVQAKPITLVLEIKSSHLYPEIEHQIIEYVKKFDMWDQVVIISFNYNDLEKVNTLAPNLSLGFLWPWPLLPHGINSSKIKVVSVFWPTVILNPFLVRNLHNRGCQVWVWTVNNPQLMRLLFWLGVDGITTDHPNLRPEAASASIVLENGL